MLYRTIPQAAVFPKDILWIIYLTVPLNRIFVVFMYVRQPLTPINMDFCIFEEISSSFEICFQNVLNWGKICYFYSLVALQFIKSLKME